MPSRHPPWERAAWGGGLPRSPGGRRSEGAGGAGAGGLPGKLGGSAGRASRFAHSAVGRGGRRGVPHGGPGGAGKLETAKTMRPRRRPPQTMAGTVRPGPAEGASAGAGGGAWPGPGPPRAPPRAPQAPQIRAREPRSSAHLRAGGACAGLCFLDVKLGFLLTPFNFKDSKKPRTNPEDDPSQRPGCL